jgi:hypothetical protein
LKGIVVDTLIHATEPFLWPDGIAFERDNVVMQVQRWLPECDASPRCYSTNAAKGAIYLNLYDLLDNYFERMGCQGPRTRHFGDFSYSIDEQCFSALSGNAVIITRTGHKGFVLGEPKMDD